MNPEIKAQWTAALRSGAYHQIDGQLKLGDAMCCLGVLCDLARMAGVGEWDGNEFVTREHDVVVAVDHQVPSPAVQAWAGLSAGNPIIEEEGVLRLALFNDGSVAHDIEPHTFAQIADLIDTHL